MRLRGVFRGALTGVFAAVCLAASAATPAVATETATGVTPAVLQVDGAVDGGKAVTIDMAALKSLPAVTVTTVTPWTDHEDTYVGVRMRDLLDRFGAKGTSVIAAAVDDYAVTIPMRDFRDYDVIVAYAVDGKPLPPEDKGPFWIIYPFSAYSTLQTDLYFSRSVWQLNRLTVQ